MGASLGGPSVINAYRSCLFQAHLRRGQDRGQRGETAGVAVRSLHGGDQILRLVLMLLNHQNRIAPTTITNKIISFIGVALSATG